MPPRMYSAYYKDDSLGWTGIHRLTLSDAVYVCKQYKIQQDPFCTVAVVPDNTNPFPVFDMVERFALA